MESWSTQKADGRQIAKKYFDKNKKKRIKVFKNI